MATSEELSFGDLLQGLRAGSQDAANLVFHQYVQRLLGLARNRLSERARQKAGVEDVVQSALHSFFLHHAEVIELQSEDSLWHKLLEITLRHCGKWNKRFRAKKRARTEIAIHPGQDGDAGLDPGDDEPTPLEAATLADLVEHVMGDLTDRQREVFQLRLQGFAVREISARISLSEALVYRAIEQVRARVMQEMKQDQ